MNSNANCLLIVNPRSGTADKDRIIKSAIETLLEAGICVETAMTERPGHATELAADAAADGVDIVVAVGGDGTVNETARGLCNTSSTLGIIPTGSGNGLARHLGIPTDPLKAAEVLTAGRIEECDYCTVNDRPFFCTFGVGFDASVAHRFASRPGSRGLINYVRSALEELVTFRAEEYTISCNNTILTKKAFLIACCNASQYGNNAYIAPDASIKDGLIDVTMFHSGILLQQAINGIDMLLGTIHDGHRVHTFRTPRMVIYRRRPGPVHLDGDPAMMGTRLVVRCHPRALRVLSPGEVHVKPLIKPIVP